MIKKLAMSVLQPVAALAWGCLILGDPALARQNRPDGPVPSLPAAGSQVEKPGVLTNRPEDEKAIRGVGDAFARAFAAGDSRSVAAMFSEDAELIDESGQRILGRPSIEEYYDALFQARPKSTIEIAIDSLRFLSPDVAKEEGHTRVKSSDEAATLRRYTVLYIKQDGRWLYSSARRIRCCGRPSRAVETARLAGGGVGRSEFGFNRARQLPLVNGQEFRAPRLYGSRAGPTRDDD